MTLQLNSNYSLIEVQKDTFNEALINDYFNHLDASDMTKRIYKYCVSKFVKWLQDNQIEVVTQDHIIEYKNELKTHLQANSINTHITAIKDLFKYLETKGFNNVSKYIKKERVNKEFKRDCLTSEQVRAILLNTDKTTIEGLRAYALFKLLIHTGLRECEIVRSDIKDLSVKGNQNVLFVQGKGEKEKNRFVIIQPSVMNALQEYLKVRNAKPNEPLFTSLSDRNKNKRLTTRTIQRIVKQLYKDNGIINERITTHSTRHTAITLSILQGDDITQVMDMARHKNVTTTMIYYHNLNRLTNNSENTLEQLFKDC